MNQYSKFVQEVHKPTINLKKQQELELKILELKVKDSNRSISPNFFQVPSQGSLTNQKPNSNISFINSSEDIPKKPRVPKFAPPKHKTPSRVTEYDPYQNMTASRAELKPIPTDFLRDRRIYK